MPPIRPSFLKEREKGLPDPFRTAPIQVADRFTAYSRVASVAGAIAGIIRDHGAAEVQAIGAPAVNQMVEAIITARTYLHDHGVSTTCEPWFVDVDIDGAERTAIRLTIATVGRT